MNAIGMLTRAVAHPLHYLATRGRRAPIGPDPQPGGVVPPDFFGVCVAAHPDPEGDDYLLERLRALTVRHVRLDYPYTGPGAFPERLLQRLLREGLRVCLHLVPPADEAARMLRADAQQRWRAFVGATLDRYGSALELIEIGAVCNRRRWSGYTPATFLAGWRAAWEEAGRRQLTHLLAGPNVTDFEPLYNIGLLGEMRRLGLPPAAHTTNLFVERAGEPEAFDHKIAGRRAAAWLRYNLIKKARLLRAISEWAGVPATLCAHVSWSLRRIGRWTDDGEEKQADYVARYLCLAAASGALRRVYWGPLIGQREGLIDDGTTFFPEIPHVAFYGQAHGTLAVYRLRPAFRAFQTVCRQLAGATFVRRVPTGPGLEILAFARSGEQDHERLHVVWTRDGLAAESAACYAPDTLHAARVVARDGAIAACAPALFSESPTYLVWPADADIRLSAHPAPIAHARFTGDAARRVVAFVSAEWTGLTLAEDDGTPVEPAPLLALALGSTDETPGVHLLRDSRNRVWRAPAPWNADQALVIKQCRPASLFRRLLRHGQPPRSLRSWNGAHDLLRRGLPTPMPVACFHQTGRGAAGDSYYLCRAFEGGWSVRDAFTAFSRGAGAFHELTPDALYTALAGFLGKLHGRGVYFRDLSAGNLLFRRQTDGALAFALIDTARARFRPTALGMRERLCDLMRLCHPLRWVERERFVGAYLAALNRSFSPWLRLPFYYYDAKHRLKKLIRPFRLRR